MPIELDDGEVMITTDGFTVQPLEFPGGNIGSLAVHGTTNDLAVAGARPMYLTLNAFIEEGLEIEVLDRIVASLAEAARESKVSISAGDTKVLRRGEGGGLYLATTGVGLRPPECDYGFERIQPGDQVLASQHLQGSLEMFTEMGASGYVDVIQERLEALDSSNVKI